MNFAVIHRPLSLASYAPRMHHVVALKTDYFICVLHKKYLIHYNITLELH